MFQISDKLMRQCIEMVANEFDYIYPADGIDENYSVVNRGEDGVWIAYNLDESEVQQIVLMYTFDELDPVTQAIALENVRKTERMHAKRKWENRKAVFSLNERINRQFLKTYIRFATKKTTRQTLVENLCEFTKTGEYIQYMHKDNIPGQCVYYKDLL
jgi:hypothetical protein